jgi:hypothetical protein
MQCSRRYVPIGLFCGLLAGCETVHPAANASVTGAPECLLGNVCLTAARVSVPTPAGVEAILVTASNMTNDELALAAPTDQDDWIATYTIHGTQTTESRGRDDSDRPADGTIVCPTPKTSILVVPAHSSVARTQRIDVSSAKVSSDDVWVRVRILRYADERACGPVHFLEREVRRWGK